MPFELEIDQATLQQRKVFVATPMYGGQCGGHFAKTCIDLAMLAQNYGLDYRFFSLYNESLVTRARNYLVDEFLRSNYTHMMFIDADIGFNPEDVLALAAIASPGSEYDIVCGAYPKKCISWEKVKRAVDKGFGDKNPENLENFIGDYVFNPVSGSPSIPLDEPVEVLEGGTGFMMIQRSVFEDFRKAYPHLSYRPDHARTEHFDGTREIHAYFDALVDDKNANIIPEVEAFYAKNPNATPTEVIEFLRDKTNGLTRQYSNRYLSEDYMFCQWARNIGKKVWLCPWMKLQHMGTYVFAGSLPDLAMVGVSPTADFHEMGKSQKVRV